MTGSNNTTTNRETEASRDFVRFATCCFSSALICACLAEVKAQDHSRTIGYGMPPIADRLLPSDDLVIIERASEGAEPTSEPTTSNAIVDATHGADIIAVVDVDAVTSGLVDDGTWIRTRLAGTVREVIRSSGRRKVPKGQRVQMEIDGGEVRIGKVLVKAYPLRLPLQRPYLLFMAVTHGFTPAEDGGWIPSAAYVPLLLEGSRLKDTRPEDAPPTFAKPLDGLLLSDVVKQVRRVKS